jgi:hypothetical protein
MAAMRTLAVMSVATLTLSAVVVVVAGATQNPQVNFTRTNLQVLPKDVPIREMVNLMRSFAIGLGVRCAHCHVGEGNDLSTFDFASDALPAKHLAREMMRMTSETNARVAALVKADASPPKLTCYTCHRGSRTPATMAPEPVGGGGSRR